MTAVLKSRRTARLNGFRSTPNKIVPWFELPIPSNEAKLYIRPQSSLDQRLTHLSTAPAVVYGNLVTTAALLSSSRGALRSFARILRHSTLVKSDVPAKPVDGCTLLLPKLYTVYVPDKGNIQGHRNTGRHTSVRFEIRGAASQCSELAKLPRRERLHSERGILVSLTSRAERVLHGRFLSRRRLRRTSPSPVMQLPSVARPRPHLYTPSKIRVACRPRQSPREDPTGRL